MKKSELLKRAKDLLSKTSEDRRYDVQPYICIALLVAARNAGRSPAVETIREALADEVRLHIDKRPTMCVYYQYKGIKLSYEELQQKRHELVDAMIANYEAKGE